MHVSKAISIQEMTSFIQGGMTFYQISSMLQSKNQTARGLSPRSIRRFCKTVNYHLKKSEQTFINVVF